MIGMKIRAWMDNIVRTKKSKSKKQHSSGISNGSGGIMVGSPTLIRRSEISPLQSTTGGRAGWKTPDSPVHGKIEVAGRRVGHVEFSSGDDRFRYNYRSEEVKKVIIETRPHSKRSTTTVEEKKHYSHSSSEFGSVMNYISSPESAYSTGYSTLHSDDCVSPAVANASPKPDFHLNNNNIQRNGVSSFHTPSYHLVEAPVVAPLNCPSTTSYVDSPSPRQRSRIRTNPWYKNQAGNSSSSNSLMPNGGGLGSKSSSPYRSQSNCSSPSRPIFNGCDIAIKGNFNVSPNSLRKRKLVDTIITAAAEQSFSYQVEGSVDSLNEDDDSTLKEIMGKFDEISYTYDKETDILSDSSDHTQCQEQSDYEDTGQDAEDEYEEEIDFIDKHALSITEESVKYKNSGSCEYYENVVQQPISRASLKMRKRLRRKSSKRSSGCNTPEANYQQQQQQQRECRSVGGTPILNRRASSKKQTATHMNNSDRANSLNTLNSPQKTLITIAESERQLLKSDLDAFIKYRELIAEAETILGSFKSAETSANHQQQHQAMARNIPPHLPNKRVEMLRAEVVQKRPAVATEVLLTNHHHNLHQYHHHSNNNSASLKPPGPPHKLPSHNFKPHSPLPVHKTIEILKQEQYAFGPPPPSQPQLPTAPKMNAKENYPPPYYSPKPMHRIPVQVMNCPRSEPLKRKIYIPPGQCGGGGGGGAGGFGKQEMILKTLQDLKRSLEDQKTQLYTLNEKP